MSFNLIRPTQHQTDPCGLCHAPVNNHPNLRVLFHEINHKVHQFHLSCFAMWSSLTTNEIIGEHLYSKCVCTDSIPPKTQSTIDATVNWMMLTSSIESKLKDKAATGQIDKIQEFIQGGATVSLNQRMEAIARAYRHPKIISMLFQNIVIPETHHAMHRESLGRLALKVVESDQTNLNEDVEKALNAVASTGVLNEQQLIALTQAIEQKYEN